ncbi:LEPR-XLL domain-containing protein [Fibrobacter sp. UWB12]|uniref:LEPR-XLL domain-containing protein n=1 Tax=Fibrobacter sp. UWB12 TaxID=1896203 RepID=UPI001587DA38|nr:LEPR-XLL domain-containing protein [Fibrobacter sp. UWB12]
MSKMNNNSRKNVKNSKNVSKKAVRSRKSSKKNFKIETLEPRLMMDASAGFDVDKIEEYTSQFETIATIISEKASSAIEYFNEVDVTNVGVPKKFKPFLIGIAR